MLLTGGALRFSRVVEDLFDHPPGPFLAWKEVRFVAEGRSQTPGKGASPICAPHPSDAR